MSLTQRRIFQSSFWAPVRIAVYLTFNCASVYSVHDVATVYGSALLSFTTLKAFDPVVHGGFLTSTTARRTRRRRIHAVLGRKIRLQRPWIFLVRVQRGMGRPRGHATERLQFKRVWAEWQETERSSRRAPGFSRDSRPKRPGTQEVLMFLRSGTGAHGGFERYLRGLPVVRVLVTLHGALCNMCPFRKIFTSPLCSFRRMSSVASSRATGAWSRTLYKAVQDWRSGRVPLEPSFSSGFCEHDEEASCATRFLLLAFELVSRASKSENKAGESLTCLRACGSCSRAGNRARISSKRSLQSTLWRLGPSSVPSQLRLSVYNQRSQWYLT